MKIMKSFEIHITNIQSYVVPIAVTNFLQTTDKSMSYNANNVHFKKFLEKNKEIDRYDVTGQLRLYGMLHYIL